MADARDDLRSTSDSIQDDAVRLKDLEQEKMRLDPEDARAMELAREIEELSHRLADKARAERELIDEIRGN